MSFQQRYAFFDVDDTLISIKSMFDFFPFWCAKTGQSSQVKGFEEVFAIARARGTPREELNRLYYQYYRGASLKDLEAVGMQWFADRFETSPAPYYLHVTGRLEAHRIGGVEPVFVSGSMLPLLSPIASDLKVTHILCTQLTLDQQGLLTGEIGTPQTIGEGKAVAIQHFLAGRNAAPEDCFAYGDDPSDIAMLESVGNSVAVGDQPELLVACQRQGWGRLAI
nr:HAD-IB family hydrolase [uncultured Halomonas sp.]